MFLECFIVDCEDGKVTYNNASDGPLKKVVVGTSCVFSQVCPLSHLKALDATSDSCLQMRVVTSRPQPVRSR